MRGLGSIDYKPEPYEETDRRHDEDTEDEEVLGRGAGLEHGTVRSPRIMPDRDARALGIPSDEAGTILGGCAQTLPQPHRFSRQSPTVRDVLVADIRGGTQAPAKARYSEYL